MKINLLTAWIIAASLLIGCDNSTQEKAIQADRHQRAAANYAEQGQYRAAVLEAKNAIQLQPSSAKGYAVLGELYNQVGGYSAAKDLLEPKIETMPELALPLATAYLSLGKFQSIINLLSPLAIPSDSESAINQLSLLGRAYLAIGDQSKFDTVLKKLAAIDGGDIENNYLLAGQLLSAGKHEQASEYLAASLTEAPDHFKSLLLQAELLLLQEKTDESEKLLIRALNRTKNADVMTVDRASVISQLINVLLKQGRSAEAMTYQKLLGDASANAERSRQLFSDALELYQQGKITEAKNRLEEMVVQFPGDKNAPILLALINYQQGNDREAISLFDHYMDPETANTDVIQAAAIAKFRSEHIDEALELLHTAVIGQPNNAQLQATLGLALLEKDAGSVEGIAAIEHSLALNKNQQRLRLALARYAIERKDKTEAINQLALAYQEQPLDFIIQQSYFQVLIGEGELAKVEQLVADFKQAHTDNPRALLLEGWLALHQSKPEAAIQSFKSAAKTAEGQDKLIALMGLAQTYEYLKDWSKASAAWRSALDQDPNMAENYGKWLNALKSANHLHEAMPQLQKLKSETKSWAASVVIAQLLYNDGKLNDAINEIDLALKHSNDAPQVKTIAANLYHELALSDRNANRLEQSKIHLITAHKLNPKSIVYLSSLVDAELFDKSPSAAQLWLDGYSPKEEDLAGYYFLQGAIHRANNQPKIALTSFQASWQQAPSDSAAEAIIQYYDSENDQAAVDQWLNSWIETLPKNIKPLLIAAVRQQQKENKKEAISLYEKSLMLSENIPLALNNLAWLYYEESDERALVTAKKAYELEPDSPMVLDTYGWILVEHGKLEEGIHLLEKGAQLSNQNSEIVDHLTQAKARLK